MKKRSLVLVLLASLSPAVLACRGSEEGGAEEQGGAAPEAAAREASAKEKPAGGTEEKEKKEQEKDEKKAAGEDPALAAMREFIGEQEIDKSSAYWKNELPKPPEVEFDPESEYFWDLRTNKGDMTLRFMPDVAPMHVSSTVYLTELGFYDGIAFHRVIPGFMAQGGCPLGNGRGNPGYEYAGEFDPEVRHDRPGLLSMANRGPGTDGSQFFITFVATPHLDGKHTIFGEVVDGMDTLRELERAGTAPAGKPKEPLSIEKASIRVEPKEAG